MQTQPLSVPSQTFPKPVALPVEECRRCGGEGYLCVEVWDFHGLDRCDPVECEECHTEEVVTPRCEICGDDATTVLDVPGCEFRRVCDDCGKGVGCCLDPSDGLDFVVAFALAVLP